VDSTTLEANAAMKTIVRKDTSETYEQFLTRLAQESGFPTPTREDLAHLYEIGRMRRLHLRGRENIHKRLLIHAGGFNLNGRDAIEKQIPAIVATQDARRAAAHDRVLNGDIHCPRADQEHIHQVNEHPAIQQKAPARKGAENNNARPVQHADRNHAPNDEEQNLRVMNITFQGFHMRKSNESRWDRVSV
jgi:hypothetical protein